MGNASSVSILLRKVLFAQANGVSFSCSTNKRRPNTLLCFITLSEGYYHCDYLSIPRHRLVQSPRQAMYEATLAERLAEGWANAYRSNRIKKVPYLTQLNFRSLVTSRNRKKRYIRPSTGPFKHLMNTRNVKTDTTASYCASLPTTCCERTEDRVMSL